MLTSHGREKTNRDLGLLKRDRELQKRYEEWAEGVKSEHGSIGEDQGKQVDIYAVDYVLSQ